MSYLRCGVNSPLPPLGEAEVFHRIGDVHVLPRYSSFIQRILQQPPSRSNKGNALAIFNVTGLFTDKRHGCLWIAC